MQIKDKNVMNDRMEFVHFLTLFLKEDFGTQNSHPYTFDKHVKKLYAFSVCLGWKRDD